MASNARRKRRMRRQRRRKAWLARWRKRRARKREERLYRRRIRAEGRYDPESVQARAEARGELWGAVGDAATAVSDVMSGGAASRAEAGADAALGVFGGGDDADLGLEYDDGAGESEGIGVGYAIGAIVVLFVLGAFLASK